MVQESHASLLDKELQESDRKLNTSIKISCAIVLTACFTMAIMIGVMHRLIDSRIQIATGYSIADLLDTERKEGIDIIKQGNIDITDVNFISSDNFKAIRSFMENVGIETLDVKMKDGRTFNVNILP